MDVDENQQTAGRYGVLSLPTVMLFADGAACETIFGARSRKHYARALAKLVPAP
jgi:thioredoxin 1